MFSAAQTAPEPPTVEVNCSCAPAVPSTPPALERLGNAMQELYGNLQKDRKVLPGC